MVLSAGRFSEPHAAPAAIAAGVVAEQRGGHVGRGGPGAHPLVVAEHVVGALGVRVVAAEHEELAGAGLSLFALSTFDTDYVLLRAENRERAESVLRASGHRFVSDERPR